MATVTIIPTRMELKKFQKKLFTAKKGYKLLKDKNDELTRKFINFNKTYEKTKKETEDAMKAAIKNIIIAESLSEKEIVFSSFMIPKQKITLNIEKQNVMSVIIPKYEINYEKNDSDIFSYSYAFTPYEMDIAVSEIAYITKKLILLAEYEKKTQLLYKEMIKTSRRVNALEHVIIPQYEKTINYIRMKLEENERGTIGRLMKFKDIMIKQHLKKDLL